MPRAHHAASTSVAECECLLGVDPKPALQHRKLRCFLSVLAVAITAVSYIAEAAREEATQAANAKAQLGLASDTGADTLLVIAYAPWVFLLAAIVLPYIAVPPNLLLRTVMLCASAVVHVGEHMNTDTTLMAAEYVAYTSVDTTILRASILCMFGGVCALYPLCSRRFEWSYLVVFEVLCMFAVHRYALRGVAAGASFRTIVAIFMSTAVPFPATYALLSSRRVTAHAQRAKAWLGAPSPPPSPPPPDPLKALHDATVRALSGRTWQDASEVLHEHLVAVFGRADTEQAVRYQASCKELYTLFRVHGAIGAERAFAKLEATMDAMEQVVAKRLCVSLHGFLENRLKFGVVQHLVEGHGLETLAEQDVPPLLDRYRWRQTTSRAHFERYVIQVARALTDLRSEVHQAEAARCASILEVEAKLSHAMSRVDKCTKRAFDKHWHACVDPKNGLPSSAMGEAIRSKVSTTAKAAVDGCIKRETRRIDAHFGVDGSGADAGMTSFEELVAQMKLEDGVDR